MGRGGGGMMQEKEACFFFFFRSTVHGGGRRLQLSLPETIVKTVSFAHCVRTHPSQCPSPCTPGAGQRSPAPSPPRRDGRPLARHGRRPRWVRQDSEKESGKKGGTSFSACAGVCLSPLPQSLPAARGKLAFCRCRAGAGHLAFPSGGGVVCCGGRAIAAAARGERETQRARFRTPDHARSPSLATGLSRRPRRRPIPARPDQDHPPHDGPARPAPHQQQCE